MFVGFQGFGVNGSGERCAAIRTKALLVSVVALSARPARYVGKLKFMIAPRSSRALRKTLNPNLQRGPSDRNLDLMGIGVFAGTPLVSMCELCVSVCSWKPRCCKCTGIPARIAIMRTCHDMWCPFPMKQHVAAKSSSSTTNKT